MNSDYLNIFMRRISVKVIFIVSFIPLFFNFAHGSYSQKPSEVSDTSSEGYLYTQFSGDVLTVDIRDVALEKVLEEISAQNGITFVLPPFLGEEKIMVRFSDYKVDRGLNKILTHYNRIFIYTEDDDSAGQLPCTRLKEVRIYPRSYEGDKKGRVEMASIVHRGASTGSKESEDEGSKDTGSKKYLRKESVKNKKGRIKSVGELSKDLESKNPDVRLKAVKALARIGNDKAMGDLFSAMKDKNPRVRREAEEALKGIGEELQEESSNSAQTGADEEEGLPPGKGEKTLSLKVASEGGVNLELNNDVPVRAVQFTIEGAQPTEVHTTSRTEGFLAQVNEKNGMVVLVSISGKTIAPGTGPIAEVVCKKGRSAHLSDYRIE